MKTETGHVPAWVKDSSEYHGMQLSDAWASKHDHGRILGWLARWVLRVNRQRLDDMIREWERQLEATK